MRTLSTPLELDTCFVLWIRRLFPSGPCHAVHDLSLSWAVPLLNWRPASSFRAQSLIMLFPRVILQLLWKPDVVFAVSNTNSSKTRQRPWGLTGEEQSPWGKMYLYGLIGHLVLWLFAAFLSRRAGDWTQGLLLFLRSTLLSYIHWANISHFNHSDCWIKICLT